ncbi:L-threonylcarbamoyladenylate synthase [Patescibacteria group bacterium]|nr:L-threonylcarbamoyladenylate synthase [Patescibacteria group bacterium]MCL5409754.1 L-threonylcarbamoyladenylate synthase [Patescibacteria group bacterium]
MLVNNQLSQLIKEGKIAVIPTDTLYGIVGSALNPQTVEKIYQLRKRDLSKPMIILIASIKDLGLFNIQLDQKTIQLIDSVWPNPLSIIFPCPNERLTYLHRGSKTLALRIPDKPDLRALLKKTGPLVAPSANLAGEKPAQNITEAKVAFGEQVNYYLDQGKLSGQSSTLAKLVDHKFAVLRPGAYTIPTQLIAK